MATTTAKQTPKPIDQNQYTYLSNLASGKNPDGSKATAGNIAWAKSQLAQSSYTPPKTPETKLSAPPVAQPKTNPQNIPAANTGSYNAPTTTPSVAPQMATPQPITIPDWTTKQTELFGRLESILNTPFQYNPESDPAYQAQRQLAKLRAGDASRQAMEIANEKGILGSSMTGESLAQIQQRAEQEAAAYIPQYRAEAYNQYQDRLRNIGELLGTARNLGQDVFNRNVTEAELTGNYLSPDARNKINRIIELGEAWKTGTPEQQAQYHQEANRLRAELQGMGIDPSLFGADKTTEQRLANVGRAGVRTLAGQQFDQNLAQQEWENMFRQQQFDEEKAARLWEQAFKEKSFAQEVKEAAAARGLQWANLNQRQKEFIADQAFREKQFQLELDKFNASQGGSQLTDKESTDNFNMIFDDLQTPGVTKEQARQLLQANRDFLNDSDYAKLNNWINENL